jgi:hypothetical protein
MANSIQDNGQSASPRYVKEYTRSSDNSQHTVSGDKLTDNGKQIDYPHTHIIQDSSGTIFSAHNEDYSLNTHPKKST